MEENTNTAVLENAVEESAPAPAGGQGPLKKKNKKKKKLVRTIIICLIILIAAGAIAFGIYRLFFTEEEVPVMTEFLYRGPIQTIVQGSGVTKAKESANIVVKAKGEVKFVYVEMGQTVAAGDKLYEISSQTAQDDLDAAEQKLNRLNKELEDTYKKAGYLNVTAPHSGKLMEVDSSIKVGDKLSEGAKIATLCDDTRMRLTQYFSYAYENDIRIGMAANVSIPGSMAVVSGHVSDIEKVRKITAEGTVLFEVEFLIDNPGALTKDMIATATITDSDGSLIAPSEPGKLEYYAETEVEAKASGTVGSINRLKNYYDVGAGAVLISLESDVFDDTILEIEKQIETAEETLREAQDMFDSFNAAAPISGVVMSCSLIEGETVESGTLAITISDVSTILVEAQIDEMDVNKVSPGVMVEIVQYERESENMIFGIIESVSLEGKYENGVSYFPAMIKVENTENMLRPGMYTSYKLVASEKDDCLIAPIQSVKYTEFGTCLFVREGMAYENMVELGEGQVPEGFVAIQVETGIGSDTGVEIISGAEEGYEVYTQAANQNPWGYYR